MIVMMVLMMTTMMSVLDAREAGAGARTGETLGMEKLRDVLLTLGGAGRSQPLAGSLGMPPHDPDWLIPLGFILVALFGLLCVMVYLISRWANCKDRTGGSVFMFGHECLVASLGMVLLIVLSLASLYYFYCFRGGCYGAALEKEASFAAGRKVKIIMTR